MDLDDSLLTSHGSTIDKIPVFKRADEVCDYLPEIVPKKTNDGGKDGGNEKEKPLPTGLPKDIAKLIKKIEDKLSKEGFGDVDLKLKEHFGSVGSIADIFNAKKAVEDILAKLPESTQKAIGKTISEVLKGQAGGLVLRYGSTAMSYAKEVKKLCKALGGFSDS